MSEHTHNWQVGEEGAVVCLESAAVVGANDFIESLQAENAKLRNIAETALKLRGRLKEVGIDTPWLDGALQEAGYNV